jgi:hypothetical protein
MYLGTYPHTSGTGEGVERAWGAWERGGEIPLMFSSISNL